MFRTISKYSSPRENPNVIVWAIFFVLSLVANILGVLFLLGLLPIGDNIGVWLFIACLAGSLIFGIVSLKFAINKITWILSWISFALAALVYILVLILIFIFKVIFKIGKTAVEIDTGPDPYKGTTARDDFNRRMNQGIAERDASVKKWNEEAAATKAKKDAEAAEQVRIHNQVINNQNRIK